MLHVLAPVEQNVIAGYQYCSPKLSRLMKLFTSRAKVQGVTTDVEIPTLPSANLNSPPLSKKDVETSVGMIDIRDRPPGGKIGAYAS